MAKQAQSLLDAISGAHGNVRGDYNDFKGATEQGLKEGIAPLWNNSETDPFSHGYSFEYQGMMNTYDNMKKQLTLLIQACNTTVNSYNKKEHDSKSTVNDAGWKP